MKEVELTVELDDHTYTVTINAGLTWEDDSFDHDWGGRRQTEECGHWELDWDETEIGECTDEDGDEIDPETVPGLMEAIQEEAESIDYGD